MSVLLPMTLQVPPSSSFSRSPCGPEHSARAEANSTIVRMDTSDNWNAKRMSRRGFIKTAGVGAAGLLLSGPARAAQESGKRAAKKTLKILQWNHFVPAYDKWFNETYIKEWGAKNDTEVTVDNIGVTALPARMAAESAAGKGHDLFLSMSPPAAYENSVVDMTDVYQECEKKYGKPIQLAVKC